MAHLVRLLAGWPNETLAQHFPKQEGNDSGDMEEVEGIVAGISMTGVSAHCSAVKEG